MQKTTLDYFIGASYMLTLLSRAGYLILLVYSWGGDRTQGTVVEYHIAQSLHIFVYTVVPDL